MTGELEQLRARIVPHLARLPGAKGGFALTKLKGDASTRSYFRLKFEQPEAESLVVMVLPGDTSKADEVTAGGVPARMPFLDVHDYLAKCGVRVPRIHLEAVADGLIFLEDLGDLTFEKVIGLKTVKQWEDTYQHAIDLLVEMQAKTRDVAKSGCLAATRRFDYGLLYWECQHFLEYGLIEKTGRRPVPEDTEVIEAYFESLCRTLERAPAGFVHRDYQSRNLMLCQDKLVIIDFQDALLGPVPYDLVALLRDSYIELPMPMVLRLMEYYMKKAREAGMEPVPDAQFPRFFHLQTLQRKLKDAGRFIFIDRVRKNPDFLPYYEPSLRYVREAFAELAEYAELQETLARYVPELAA